MVNLLWMSERFTPDIGGVARSADRIVRSLTALDVTVDVVTWSRYLQPGEVLPPEVFPTEQGQLRVHRLGLYRHWDMTLPHTLNLLDWLHEHQQFDAVFGHYLFPAGFVAAWFAKLQGLPSVVNARGNDVDRGMFPPGDFARLQWTLENASQITAVSQAMARKVEALSQQSAMVLANVVDGEVFNPGREGQEEQGEQPFDKLRGRGQGKPYFAILDNLYPSRMEEGQGRQGEQREQGRQEDGYILAEICDDSQSKELRQSLGILDDEVVLGFSGELREKKGQRFLLQALSEVRAERPACLLIMGELRPESQAFLKSYEATNPDDAARVIVTGHLDQPGLVAQHLRLCDVYLQPSLWEGMPNALLEAMACGCGCIGSDAGGIPEIIEHGVTGFVLSRAQLHHLGRAVLEYLALEPAVKAEIVKRGCDRIAQYHTLNQERDVLLSLLQELKLVV